MPVASGLIPLWDRSAEWSRRLAMVRDAKQFLYLSTFYIEHDAYGRQMLAALLDAQRRGVSVQLIVDSFGQRLGGVLMTAEARAHLASDLEQLQAAGADVRWYRPPRAVQRWLGGGQHVKIQVSEAGEAIFGSSNLTKSSFEGWNEFAVVVRGAVTVTLTESLNAIGGRVAASHLDRLRAAAASAPDECPLDYWFCNPNDAQGMLGPLAWRGRNALTDRLITAIDGAAREVLVTSFYFKPVPALMEALVRAARRGVRVEVHHSHREALPATDLAWIAAATSYPRLLAAGVQIYENLRGEHSKVVLVDDAWAAFGTYNFEDAAHDRLAEGMLAGHDAQAVQVARGVFEAVRRQPHNLRVTVETLAALPSGLRRRVRWLGRLKRWM